MTVGTDRAGSLSEVSRLGWRVAGWLAALTIVEYVIAVTVDTLVILWLLPFVAAKGWLILDYFMHFRAFLRGDQH